MTNVRLFVQVFGLRRGSLVVVLREGWSTILQGRLLGGVRRGLPGLRTSHHRAGHAGGRSQISSRMLRVQFVRSVHRRRRELRPRREIEALLRQLLQTPDAAAQKNRQSSVFTKTPQYKAR